MSLPSGRDQALSIMKDYKDEKMSFYSCLERLSDIESDEFFDDEHLDEEDDEDEDEDDNVLGDGQQGSTSLSLVFVLLTMAFVLAVLGAIGSQMEDSKSKLTCNPATKQVDGSFASNCDSYGEYYDNGAP